MAYLPSARMPAFHLREPRLARARHQVHLSRCDGYRNFLQQVVERVAATCSELLGCDVGVDDSLPVELSAADRWIAERLQRTGCEASPRFRDYRFRQLPRHLRTRWDEYSMVRRAPKVQLATAGDAGTWHGDARWCACWKHPALTHPVMRSSRRAVPEDRRFRDWGPSIMPAALPEAEPRSSMMQRSTRSVCSRLTTLPHAAQSDGAFRPEKSCAAGAGDMRA